MPSISRSSCHRDYGARRHVVAAEDVAVVAEVSTEATATAYTTAEGRTVAAVAAYTTTVKRAATTAEASTKTAVTDYTTTAE